MWKKNLNQDSLFPIPTPKTPADVANLLMLEHLSCNSTYILGKSHCGQCGKMIQLQNIENFEVFGMNPRFEIDLQMLETSYLILQRTFHPDRYMTSESLVKETALKNTIKINEIHKILKSDSQRAEYLVNLFSPESTKNLGNCDEQKFMAEEFLKREEMIEASDEELLRLLEIQKLQKQAIIDELSDLFSRKMFQEAAKIIVKLKYNEKFLKDLKLRT